MYPDCQQKVPAHKLKLHYRYECRSYQIKHRHMLIERARIRNNYSRPWGIRIPLQLSDDDSSEDSIVIEEDSSQIPSTVKNDSKFNILSTVVKSKKSSPKSLKVDGSKDVKKTMMVNGSTRSKSSIKDFNDSDSEGDDVHKDNDADQK